MSSFTWRFFKASERKSYVSSPSGSEKGDLNVQTISDVWDTTELARIFDLLKAKITKIQSWKSKFPDNDNIIGWLRDWRLRQREDKAANLIESIIPRYRKSEDDLKIWLEALQTKKRKTIQKASHSLRQIITNKTCLETQSDLYDDLLNETRLLIDAIEKEMKNLKHMADFIEDAKTRKKRKIKRAKSILPMVDISEEYLKFEPATMPPINTWQGYSGAAGKKLATAAPPPPPSSSPLSPSQSLEMTEGFDVNSVTMSNPGGVLKSVKDDVDYIAIQSRLLECKMLGDDVRKFESNVIDIINDIVAALLVLKGIKGELADALLKCERDVNAPVIISSASIQSLPNNSTMTKNINTMTITPGTPMNVVESVSINSTNINSTAGAIPHHNILLTNNSDRAKNWGTKVGSTTIQQSQLILHDREKNKELGVDKARLFAEEIRVLYVEEKATYARLQALNRFRDVISHSVSQLSTSAKRYLSSQSLWKIFNRSAVYDAVWDAVSPTSLTYFPKNLPNPSSSTIPSGIASSLNSRSEGTGNCQISYLSNGTTGDDESQVRKEKFGNSGLLEEMAAGRNEDEDRTLKNGNDGSVCICTGCAWQQIYQLPQPDIPIASSTFMMENSQLEAEILLSSSTATPTRYSVRPRARSSSSSSISSRRASSSYEQSPPPPLPLLPPLVLPTVYEQSQHNDSLPDDFMIKKSDLIEFGKDVLIPVSGSATTGSRISWPNQRNSSQSQRITSGGKSSSSHSGVTPTSSGKMSHTSSPASIRGKTGIDTDHHLPASKKSSSPASMTLQDACTRQPIDEFIISKDRGLVRILGQEEWAGATELIKLGAFQLHGAVTAGAEGEGEGSLGLTSGMIAEALTKEQSGFPSTSNSTLKPSDGYTTSMASNNNSGNSNNINNSNSNNNNGNSKKSNSDDNNNSGNTNNGGQNQAIKKYSNSNSLEAKVQSLLESESNPSQPDESRSDSGTVSGLVPIVHSDQLALLWDSQAMISRPASTSLFQNNNNNSNSNIATINQDLSVGLDSGKSIRSNKSSEDNITKSSYNTNSSSTAFPNSPKSSLSDGVPPPFSSPTSATASKHLAAAGHHSTVHFQLAGGDLGGSDDGALSQDGLLAILVGGWKFETLLGAFGLRDEFSTGMKMDLPVLVWNPKGVWIRITRCIEKDILIKYVELSTPNICRCPPGACSTLPFALPLHCVDRDENLEPYLPPATLFLLMCSWRCSGDMLTAGLNVMESLQGSPFVDMLLVGLRRAVATHNVEAAEELVSKTADSLRGLLVLRRKQNKKQSSLKTAFSVRPKSAAESIYMSPGEYSLNSPAAIVSFLEGLDELFRMTIAYGNRQVEQHFRRESSSTPPQPPGSPMITQMSSFHSVVTNNSPPRTLSLDTLRQNEHLGHVTVSVPSGGGLQGHPSMAASLSHHMDMLVPLGALKIFMTSTPTILSRLDGIRSELDVWLKSASSLANRIDISNRLAKYNNSNNSKTRERDLSNGSSVHENDIHTVVPSGLNGFSKTTSLNVIHHESKEHDKPTDLHESHSSNSIISLAQLGRSNSKSFGTAAAGGDHSIIGNITNNKKSQPSHRNTSSGELQVQQQLQHSLQIHSDLSGHGLPSNNHDHSRSQSRLYMPTALLKGSTSRSQKATESIAYEPIDITGIQVLGSATIPCRVKLLTTLHSLRGELYETSSSSSMNMSSIYSQSMTYSDVLKKKLDHSEDFEKSGRTLTTFTLNEHEKEDRRTLISLLTELSKLVPQHIHHHNHNHHHNSQHYDNHRDSVGRTISLTTSIQTTNTHTTGTTVTPPSVASLSSSLSGSDIGGNVTGYDDDPHFSNFPSAHGVTGRNRKRSRTTCYKSLSQQLRLASLHTLLGLDAHWESALLKRVLMLALESLGVSYRHQQHHHHPLASGHTVGSTSFQDIPSAATTAIQSNPYLQKKSKSSDHSEPIGYDSIFERCILSRLEGNLLNRFTLFHLSKQLPLLSSLKPRLRYSSTRHGPSLSQLMEKCCTCSTHRQHAHFQPYSSFLLLVKEDTGFVFGGYFNTTIMQSDSPYGDNGVVFCAAPVLQVYPDVLRDGSNIRCSHNHLAFGCESTALGSMSTKNPSSLNSVKTVTSVKSSGKSSLQSNSNNLPPYTPITTTTKLPKSPGGALHFNAILHDGFSFSNMTFGNEKLSFRENFSIQELQIWTFEDPLPVPAIYP